MAVRPVSSSAVDLGSAAGAGRLFGAAAAESSGAGAARSPPPVTSRNEFNCCATPSS
ncbi:MAG TPA: hypothetical protein VM936_02525 [Pyrinomonadaceae bacterium]|nr:hypothetical protein [Pyrinomonadaceae bacterium]